MSSFLLVPAHWDAAYYGDRASLLAIAQSTDPDLVVRRLHAKYVLGDGEESDRAVLAALDDILEAPAWGLQLLALVGLGEYERVAEANFAPRGYTPLKIEEAVYGHLATSQALCQLERYEEAKERLIVARDLASMLGMTGRVRMIGEEKLRQQLVSGERPQHGEAGLGADSASPTQQQLDNTFATLITQARYAEAYKVAVERKLKPHAARLAAALAMKKHERLDEGNPYESLACAMDAIAQGRLCVPTPTGEPFWDRYVDMIVAAGQILAGDHYRALLKLPEKGPPDIMAAALGYRWTLWLHGVASPQPFLSMPGRLYTALEELPGAAVIASWLVRLFPNEMSVLSNTGRAHESITAALLHAPRLEHEAFVIAERRRHLTPVVSESLLSDGYHGGTMVFDSLHAQQKKRYRLYLAQLGLAPSEFVNPATVLRLTERFKVQAYTQGRPFDKYAADASFRCAYELLPEYVKNLLISPQAYTA